MKELNLLSVLVAVLSIALLTGQDASAIPAGNLQVKIIGHYFTTSISNGRRRYSTKKPSKGRYLVLKLAVKVPSDDSKIFTNDFVLKYFHQDGKEDRDRCLAVFRTESAKLSSYGRCAIGNAAWLKLDKSSKYLGLAFYVENDVDTIDLSRIGADPIMYKIGDDRPYSVYIITNQDPAKAEKYGEVIKAGGYQVLDIGTGLKKGTKGVTIYYAKPAEVQAREISQRIMTAMKITPVVKKMSLISSKDVIIWIGE